MMPCLTPLDRNAARNRRSLSTGHKGRVLKHAPSRRWYLSRLYVAAMIAVRHRQTAHAVAFFGGRRELLGITANLAFAESP
jgi:hypothetical protein